MPYIKDIFARKELDDVAQEFVKVGNKRFKDSIVGFLNYFIFKLAKYYIHDYASSQRFIGELECAKTEVYRRIIAPYEDKKIKENGDVEHFSC